jgi:hypothetical protein
VVSTKSGMWPSFYGKFSRVAPALAVKRGFDAGSS